MKTGRGASHHANFIAYHQVVKAFLRCRYVGQYQSGIGRPSDVHAANLPLIPHRVKPQPLGRKHRIATGHLILINRFLRDHRRRRPGPDRQLVFRPRRDRDNMVQPYW